MEKLARQCIDFNHKILSKDDGKYSIEHCRMNNIRDSFIS